MRRSIVLSLLFVVVVCLSAKLGSAAADIHDTRLLTQPAVSAQHIAFIYADNLWIADADGKNVRRLTSDFDAVAYPVFSPDGSLIAFTAQYEGNADVYVVPAAGGPCRRLTWHPAADIVRGFTPDGKAVLFISPRNSFTSRYTQLFTVPVSGGMPTQLSIPHASQACYSPDGQQIAYTPLADRSVQWKHYRGGAHSQIWVYHRDDHHVDILPQGNDRPNDLDPNWIGGTIYFRSDRNGEYNLFAYDTSAKTVRQLTTYKDFPVLNVASGGGKLIYEHAGYLYLFDPADGKCTRLVIGVASDLPDTRVRYVKGSAGNIRDADVSPSGARAVFECRGEIVTVPAEKGDPRNLTESPAANDRSPAWSPDGRSIAWFSDESGEYRLYVRPANGKGAVKSYDPHGAGFYQNPVWSPDSRKIAYIDNSASLYWIDLSNGQVEKVGSAAVFGPDESVMPRPTWSPDSGWIVYSLVNHAWYHTLYVYDLKTRQSRAITDGLSDAADPVFDASGKYLYFFASTDAGPVNQWFSQAAEDMRMRRSIYLVVLRAGVASPLARESDEEKPINKSDDKPKAKEEKSKDEKQKDAKPTEPPPVVIDFEGIQQRIVALPEPPANYANLQAGQPGQIFFLAEPAHRGLGGALKRFDLGKRKTETILAGVGTYRLSSTGKKTLVFSSAGSWSIIDADAPASPGKGALKIDSIEVRIDPAAEWREMFEDAWRINRDDFYDPGMHGTDWPAIRKKYAAFLPDLTSRNDLYRVIRWMLSELSVGHSYLMPGPPPDQHHAVPGGLLGADYEVVNGRYRFKKVYGGLNWSRELRSPLTAPGVDAKAGEYLLAVRGVELKPPTELFSLFENTAEKSIEITVGPNPDDKRSRTVTVEPLANEDALRNRDWVEGNLRRVHEATGGRAAYVYVPDTAGNGHEYFKRYYYPQSDKQAIIIDERFNGGGDIADYYISHLVRPPLSMWATRYGEDTREPGAAIAGPKVMITDETAGSGGDMLPWMFRKLHLGTLVGKRTWGGLVGILDFPPLMDGTHVTAPNLAIWADGRWVVENEGVPPDVEVEQWPADVIAGKDPQLEKAIELVLSGLAKHPPIKPVRPKYPIKVK
ncbi:MAG: PDZ domain-containing protein [Thermoguttaceae bacterium]